MFEDIKKHSSFCSNFQQQKLSLIFFLRYSIHICKKNGKIFIKVIQYIIFEDLHINIDNKNSPTLFFDILYHTTIIYGDSALGFRLGHQYLEIFSCIFWNFIYFSKNLHFLYLKEVEFE